VELSGSCAVSITCERRPHEGHGAAVVIIPPPEVWKPIQAIRRQHDRQFHRWMPHVNLLYPFYPPERFANVLPRLADACAQIAPLVVTLTSFGSSDMPRVG
jgi:hypothetical protein